MVKVHQSGAKDAPGEIVKGVAATSLIFIICAYVPIFGVIFSLFIPLPILFYRSKLGRRSAGLVFAGTFFLILLFSGGASFDVFYFAQLMVLGYALGEMLQRNLTVEKTILFACGFHWAAAAAGIFFVSASAGTDVVSMTREFIEKNLELSIAYYEGMGAPPEQIAAIKDSLDKIRFFMLRIIPGAAVSASIFVAWCNLLIARSVFSAARLKFPDFGALRSWRAPESLVWAAIASGVMLLVPEKNVFILGLNGFLILMTVYFFQGIAIASFFFDKKDFPPLLRYIIYGFIGMQLMMIWLVVAIGFFDMWFNFRKLEK